MTDSRCWILLALLVPAGCADSENGSPRTADNDPPAIRIALNWYPEAEHGGYVAADELGLFKARNRTVEIIPGSPGSTQVVLQELAIGRTQFAIASADQIVEQRFRGLPIVALLAPVQKSPRCIMVHESSGIDSLEQLSGVELAISETRPFALWMQKKLPLTDVTIVPFNGLVGEFLAKKDFAQQAYIFSEPFIAREQGGDPKSLMLSEIGFDPYASLLVTTESMIELQPEVVRDVVSASQAGWEAYLASPEKTNQRLHADNSDMSIAALEFGANALQDLCQTEGDQPFGTMALERWQTLVDQIVEIGLIEAGSVQAADCFDNQFID